MSMTEKEFLYLETHEAIDINKNIATVHLSKHCVDELGDIIFVELPEIGTIVNKDKELGSVESVKAVSDINGISGEVIDVNEDIYYDHPEMINEDPLGEGWLVKIKMSDPDEVKGLLSHEQHLDFIKE